METTKPADVPTLVFQVMELQTYGIVDTFTIQVREGSVCDFWAYAGDGGEFTANPQNKRPALKEFVASLRRAYDTLLEGPMDPVQIRDALYEASKPLVATANDALAVDSLRIV